MVVVTNRVADIFVRINHAIVLKRHVVRMMYTRTTRNVLRVLLNEGYILGFRVAGNQPRQEIEVFLKYDEANKPVIRRLRLISKASHRVHVGARNLVPVNQGLGRLILSTDRGVMSDNEARKLGIGGEVLGEVF